MRRSGFIATNDKENDVLYISHPVQDPTRNIEIGNGITVRLRPETNEFLGITWIDYNKRVGRFAENRSDGKSVLVGKGEDT